MREGLMNTKKFCISLLATSFFVPVMLANFSTNRESKQDERVMAFNVRMAADSYQTLQQPFNDLDLDVDPDEITFPDFAGQFTKLLDHDSCTSVPTSCGQAAYRQLLKAMQSGLQADFNAIQLSSGTQRQFINPQAALAYSMEGGDSGLYTIPAPPTLSSAAAAADLIEVYLMQTCRDVLFSDYGTGANSDATDLGTGSKTNNAALILDALPAYAGPKNNLGHVDATVLFRGSTAGDLIGGYISQFLLLPLPNLIPSGCDGEVGILTGVANLPQGVLSIQQLMPIPQKREFGVSWDDFISIQNGFIPKQYAYTDYDPINKRYIIDGRDIGGLVHVDSPYIEYFNALYILAGNKFPGSPIFPYNNGQIINEANGITMGIPDAFALVGGVSVEAFKAVWAQKWRCWRRLRPEAMAGLVHYAKSTNTNPYNLDASLFATYGDIDFLQLVRNTNALQATAEYDPEQLLTTTQASTYLLGQMYPEGSPAHPSYAQGHGTVAGACTTVIKAIIKDTELISSKITPVYVDPSNPANLLPIINDTTLTVGGELDKLASNISLARDFAGVHYRSDAEQSLLLGEQVAIRYLQDHARTYAEQGFTGFQLTMRDGTTILITPDAVMSIS